MYSKMYSISCTTTHLDVTSFEVEKWFRTLNWSNNAFIKSTIEFSHYLQARTDWRTLSLSTKLGHAIIFLIGGIILLSERI